tara:strand:- start:830 stop:1165 length:336 start_codon:yes stop_codon:yes gene_type:complete
MLALLSITHRITGVALTAGTLILVYWLLALAAGPGAYADATAVFGSVFGQIVLFGFSWALYYHLCNGIRHLVWDIGKGLDLESADSSGVIVLGASVLLTVLTWISAYALGG